MNTFFIFGAKYLIFLLGLLALYWFLRSTKDDQRKLFRFGVVSLPITYIFGTIGGMLYNNPRPFVTEGITPLIAHTANNGFPSDHALAAFAIAAVFFAVDRKKATVLFALAVIVAFSRVFVGVHHYLDVEASLVFVILGWQFTSFFLSRFGDLIFKKPVAQSK